MFLKVFLFALALCSVRADDLNCAELLQPLEDQHPGLGKFVIHAAGSNNTEIFDIIKILAGSWIEISSAEKTDVYHVTVADKMNDMCLYRKGFAYWLNNDLTLILKSKLIDTEHKGAYLHSLDDNVAVWLDQSHYTLGDKHLTCKNIILLKRSNDVIVASDTMERFKNQAKCKGIDVVELPSDLCDEEKIEPTE